MTVTLTNDTIRLITLFENVTGAPVKDCLTDDLTKTVYFVVEEGKIGIATGKNGKNVRNAERVIGKSIKLFEFSDDMEGFIRKLIPQTVLVKIRNDEERLVAEIKVDKKDKALVFGRDRRNVRLFKELLKRNHRIDDLIVR